MVKEKNIDGMKFSGLITDVDNNPMNSDSNRSTIDTIVIHHNAGTDDATARRTWYISTGVGTSAHYQITPDKIWGCVGENFVAYHAGNYEVNQRSIGLEHLNDTVAPTWTIAEETYKNSAKLIKDICERYSIPLDRQHIRGHKEFTSTQCPGGIDIDKLISLAKDAKDDSGGGSNPGSTNPGGTSGGGNNSNSSNKASTTAGSNGHMWRFNNFIWGAKGTSSQGHNNSNVNKDINNSGNSSSNGNNSHTTNTGQLGGKAQQAVAEALNQSHWNSTTDGGNPGIDMDGAFGAQCFDLANFYMRNIYPDWNIDGVDLRNNNFPHQYRTQLESKGWKIIDNPTFAQLTIGAITFESNVGDITGNTGYPHTEMITAIEGNIVSFLTQNLPSPSIVSVDTGGSPVGYSGGTIMSLAVPPDNIVK